ncbi:ABC transporter substrate-binding protein [Ideonella sp. 4Y16]|uniref:ABC transporter substrate-binding protein n=1 Tax=Ideonella alba TaxID=2824118 RepID=UPI001B36B1B8|nr:ABC transporter substrate-binding protein [Ideonella alba]MBQ0944294.1 ABC transporter substrate-binding protein [Ideonella alba]
MPKRTLLSLVLAAALAGAAAQAQTLRYASSGDLLTLDPHSQNESLTNMMNGQVYERLVMRDKQLGIAPQLAQSWQQLSPTKWRFKLRPGVKFHDGAAFTADDVVFSVERARQPSSQIANYAAALGEVKKIDDLTVEFTQKAPNPIFLQHLDTVFIMNKAWCEKYKVVRPQSFKDKEETYAATNANGTGPFQAVARTPGVKTSYKRFPGWWGKFDGNLQEAVYHQIANDATRTAALISGEIDFVLDPPPRDVARLRGTSGVKVIDGPENRIIYIGLDQARDSLLYGKSPDGKNPFKDVRVRRAMYQAIDIETIKSKLMNNQSAPTGVVVPSPLASFNDPEIEKRLPYDQAKARALMAEAGYGSGFEVTLDCPNNRYINDEEICVALAAMWDKIGIKVRVNAMPKVTYFPKTEKLDTSLYLFGWGGAITDAETTFTPLYRTRGANGVGEYNRGNFSNDKLDTLAAASSIEGDPAKRKELIKQVFMEMKEQVHYIPLHRQFIPWAARQNVDVVHRADNWLELAWTSVK